MSSPSEQPSQSTHHQQKQSVDLDPQLVSGAQPEIHENEAHESHAANLELKGPPRRPIVTAPSPPAPTTPASQPVSSAVPISENDSLAESLGQQPIPPPSEPMQYRAIGLIKGKYQASEEQFNRGILLTEDQTQLDAVLLGQVMSLVKKYLDLEQTYLWVVYPRTREKEETLHMQIVGVWSAEGFGPMAAMAEEDAPIEEESTPPEQPSQLAPPLQDGYFSIRGEIVFQSAEKNYLLVKIQQSPRKNSDRAKAFKLKLLGNLTDKATGYFWDLHVQRQGEELAILNGQKVALVPPKRKSKRERQETRVPRKFKPNNSDGKPSSKSHPVGKPIIKRRSSPD